MESEVRDSWIGDPEVHDIVAQLTMDPQAQRDNTMEKGDSRKQGRLYIGKLG